MKIKEWLQQLIAAIASLGALVLFWKYSNKQAADAREDKIKREDAEKTIERVKIKQEVQNEVNNYSDDVAIDKLLE